MSPVRRTIVNLDDDRGDAELLRRNLNEIPGWEVEFVHFSDPDQARQELPKRSADVLFLDYRLGAESGLDVLKALRSAGDLRPVIVLTGQGDEYAAANLVRCGADDYLLKSDISPRVLQRSIDNAEVRYHQRCVEAHNRQLLDALRQANQALENEVAERRKVEARLHEANQLLAAKNLRLAELYETAHQFVDNVSHEFRTPLTVIKEFASLLQEGLSGPLNEQQREYVGIIRDRVDDLTFMVTDMLDVSRLEAGLMTLARRTCRLTEIVDRVRTTLLRKAEAAEVTLEIAIEPQDALYCDPDKIGQVILNLVVNAIKFTPEGGQVRLWSRNDPERAQVVVGVTDQGSGISPESLQVIFERFTQVPGRASAGKGFGLGLSIARDLVHLNFGEIYVESQVGRGSTFWFTIPTAVPSALLDHYLRHLERLTPGPWQVTLATAEVAAGTAREKCDEADEFLRRLLHPSDLLYRIAAHRWVVLAAAHPQEPPELGRRVQEALREANHNRPHGALPQISVFEHGHWHARDERGELTTQFQAELTRGRAADAGR